MIAKATKARLLVRRLLTHPDEGLALLRGDLAMLTDRIFGGRKPYATQRSNDVLTDVGKYFQTDAVGFVQEEQLRRLVSEIEERIERLRGRPPFDPAFNADPDLAVCCFLICRLLRPSVVVETGVAAGVTSAFILQALAINNHGILHSIDLPPLSASDGFVGYVVPERLRGMWHMHRGPARRVLPRLLLTVGPVDVFVHDSLHSRSNMFWELTEAYDHLVAGGAIVADDVELNDAFSQIAPRFRFARVATASTTFGIGIK